jgi:AdoMet dependent proline di-methyltransferase
MCNLYIIHECGDSCSYSYGIVEPGCGACKGRPGISPCRELLPHGVAGVDSYSCSYSMCAVPVRGVPASHRAVNFFQMGLQEFTPQPQRYDVVWVQWALLYLTDGRALQRSSTVLLGLGSIQWVLLCLADGGFFEGSSLVCLGFGSVQMGVALPDRLSVWGSARIF